MRHVVEVSVFTWDSIDVVRGVPTEIELIVDQVEDFGLIPGNIDDTFVERTDILRSNEDNVREIIVTWVGQGRRAGRKRGRPWEERKALDEGYSTFCEGQHQPDVPWEEVGLSLIEGLNDSDGVLDGWRE